MRYQALIAERERLRAEFAALNDEFASAPSPLSAEAEARFDAVEQKIKANARAIEREDTVRDALKNAPADATTEPVSGVRFEVGDDRAATAPWGAQWVQAKASPETIRHAALGEQLTAIRNAKLGQGVDPRLAYLAAAQGAGETVDADGGYLVDKDARTNIMLRVTGGEVFSRVDNIPVGPNSNGIDLKFIDETSRVAGSRFGAVRGYWVDEGGSITASRPKFRQASLRLKKVAALGYASDELLQDAVAFGAIMNNAFAEELKFLAEDSIVNGDGVGKPQGFVGHASVVSVAKETGQSAATIVFENVQKMWMRLHAASRSNAVWFINQDCELQLNSLSLVIGTGGVPVYLPAGALSETPWARLMGRPVIPIEYCATLGTVGDIVLADLSQYALITKGGVRQDASIHVAFTTDEMAFRAVLRVDGQPKNAAPLTPFKGTNTLSPIITLATRS